MHLQQLLMSLVYICELHGEEMTLFMDLSNLWRVVVDCQQKEQEPD